jgi:hypothetical protein
MIMLEVGQQVRVLAPFDESFPDVYTIIDIVITEENSTVYFLNDIDGAFDSIFLEVVQ